MMNVSVVIPVKNEANNLALCLESVKELDDVVVVDSGSKDGTPQIATQYGRPVIDFKWNGRFPKKRNWVLCNYTFRYPWVLFLDADERLTSEFQIEIEEKLKNTMHNAFFIGYKNWFLGRLLRYGDPMRKMSLLRVGYGGYEEVQELAWSSLDMEVHEQFVVNGSIGVINAKLEHHDQKDLYEYYVRHNKYSTWEAQRFLSLKDTRNFTIRQHLKYQMMTWSCFPVLYFVYCYLIRGGFLDGKAGFCFAIGKMFYFYQIQAKIFEHSSLLNPKNKTRFIKIIKHGSR